MEHMSFRSSSEGLKGTEGKSQGLADFTRSPSNRGRVRGNFAGGEPATILDADG